MRCAYATLSFQDSKEEGGVFVEEYHRPTTIRSRMGLPASISRGTTPRWVRVVDPDALKSWPVTIQDKVCVFVAICFGGSEYILVEQKWNVFFKHAALLFLNITPF